MDNEVADESSSHSEADEGRSTMVLYSLAQDKQPIAGQAQGSPMAALQPVFGVGGTR